MHGVDVISAYAICGAGGLVGALLLRDALAPDEEGREALRDSRLGFWLLAAGLLHPAFLEPPRPAWSQALLATGAVGYVLSLAWAAARLAGQPLPRSLLALVLGTVTVVVLVVMPLGVHAMAVLLAWLLAAGVSLVAWSSRALILRPREANERVFGALVAATVPVHWLRAGYTLTLPGTAPDHLLLVPEALLTPLGLMYGVLPVLYVLLVFNVLHARRQARLREGMMTDQLTGALSRHALAPGLFAVQQRAQRHGQQVALVLLDIDHFKRVNDEHGHAAGDAVLQRVADRLRETLRPEALVVRFGGEEFLAVLPVPDVSAARAAAERLRQAIAQPAAPLPTSTASFGVALLMQDEKLEAALARADEALYRAKRSGRNQVQMAMAAA